MSQSPDLEKELSRALERHWNTPDGAIPGNLGEAIRYSLLAPGKRIRPRLTLSCARMLDLPWESALAPALAIEMVHCFTLIHDDLPCMDNDDFRRGRPSNHKVHGEGLALLAGDALMALAVDVLLDATRFFEKNPERVLKALRRLSWAMGPRGVIGGQAAESLLGADSRLEQLTRMHAQKTGALFTAALLMPMDLAGIADESPEGRALDAYARELGLAFQVADDIEDAPADLQGEAHPPTSILHFLSVSEARHQTRTRLQQATEALRSSWGERSEPLTRISDEVASKLK